MTPHRRNREGIRRVEALVFKGLTAGHGSRHRLKVWSCGITSIRYYNSTGHKREDKNEADLHSVPSADGFIIIPYSVTSEKCSNCHHFTSNR